MGRGQVYLDSLLAILATLLILIELLYPRQSWSLGACTHV